MVYSMFRFIPLVAALLLGASCASPGNGLTREEARAQNDKSDGLGVDICLEESWYGDGEICDDFCLFPDPDCEGNAFCTDDSTCDEGQRCNAEEFCLQDCDEEGSCDETCIGFCVASPPQVRVCGGPAELQCDEDQWCSFADELVLELARADLSGVCEDLPLLCTTVLLPVCGRDGVTYNNECNANRAGVDVASEGPCEQEEAEDPEAEAG